MSISEAVVAEDSGIAVRELDHRASDGLEVRLLWNAATEHVLVSVAERDGMDFEFQVPATHALDAFHHPVRLSSTQRPIHTARRVRFRIFRSRAGARATSAGAPTANAPSWPAGVRSWRKPPE
jgi:hypothetical protein